MDDKIFADSLEKTLKDPEWVKKNEKTLKELFPETWTNVGNLNPLKIGFTFKLLGIDWRTNDHFAKVMIYLEKIKICLRDNYLVKRNPKSIF